MSGNDGFQADPKAIATAGNAFEAQVAPITAQARKLDGIQGGSSTAGRAYASEGSAYHDVIVGRLGDLITEYSTKTGWVSGALSQTASDYSNSDSSGAGALNSAGNGA